MFDVVLQCFIGLLPNLVMFYWVWLGFTEFYWVFLCFTEFYWARIGWAGSDFFFKWKSPWWSRPVLSPLSSILRRHFKSDSCIDWVEPVLRCCHFRGGYWKKMATGTVEFQWIFFSQQSISLGFAAHLFQWAIIIKKKKSNGVWKPNGNGGAAATGA